MVNSDVYERVVLYKHISDMKHALGFDNRKVRGRKHRRFEYRRNFFAAGGKDQGDWEQLVNIGFADRMSEHCYCVSTDGLIFLERVMGVKFIYEDS